MQKGRVFGRYTIERKIGEGGMGEVYLAFDNSLERFVALKILSESFSQDAERLRRLKQEAKAASALNHPSIITIYEIGKTENIEFIAMEYVEGKTLREVIEGQTLSMKKAVKIAEQIADGLGVAHQAKIVHRDIKPENIIVRQDGYLKILDFGLAKPIIFSDQRNAEDETLEMIRTAPGVVMGSVQYMSPEQARGKEVDERSDIWSLGVVFYEMLVGKTPFEGDTVSDTLANLIHLEPNPLRDFFPEAPEELYQIVQKSLKKNAPERYQNVRETANDLKTLHKKLELTTDEYALIRNSGKMATQFSEETKTRIYQTDKSQTNQDSIKTQISQKTFQPQENKSSLFRYAVFILFGAILIGLVGFAYTKFFFSNQSAKISFQNPQISRLSDDGKSRMPAISPDGRYVAFQSGELGARNIMVRQLATESAVEVAPRSGLNILSISFSPDTNYVYYVQSNNSKTINNLYQVPTLGGTPKKIIDDIDSNITFSPDGKKLAFIRHSSIGAEGKDTLLISNIDGTEIKEIINTSQTQYGFFATPAWSPKEDKIILNVGTNIGGESSSFSLIEVSLKDAKINSLPNSVWANLREVFWQKDGSGFFLLASEKPQDPIQVWSVSYPNGERKKITNDTNSYIWLGVSGDDKTLITVRSDASSSIWSFSPASKDLTQLTPEGKNLSGDSGMTSLPNGNLIVSRYRDTDLDLWEISRKGEDVRQLTANAKFNADPRISPDGTKICFMSNRSNLWRVWIMDADGKNPRQLTVVNDEVNQYYPNFADNGKTVLFSQQEKNSGISKLMKVPIEGGVPERVFNDNTESEQGAYVSYDGKKLALSIMDTAYKKTIRIFELDGSKPISTNNQFELNLMESIKWSPDGKSMTYLNSDGIPNIWQISLDGKEKKQLTNFTAGRIFNFTWARDGKQIFITRGTVNNELILIKDEVK